MENIPWWGFWDNIGPFEKIGSQVELAQPKFFNKKPG
jgi:hypothetical protein